MVVYSAVAYVWVVASVVHLGVDTGRLPLRYFCFGFVLFFGLSAPADAESRAPLQDAVLDWH